MKVVLFEALRKKSYQPPYQAAAASPELQKEQQADPSLTAASKDRPKSPGRGL